VIPEGRINGCKGPGLGHSCRKTRKEKITAMGRTERAERERKQNDSTLFVGSSDGEDKDWPPALMY